MEDSSLDILFRLIFSHVLVDFILQTDKIVKKKSDRKCVYHIIHSLVQALVAFVFVGCWHCWYILPIIFGTHLLIDYWKVCQKNTLGIFIIDQVLHLLVIFSLWLLITRNYLLVMNVLEILFKEKSFWIVLTGYMVILKPTSLALGLFTTRWRVNNTVSLSLQNVGKWIGYLERVLILTFVLIGRIEMIGFLLATKSIFRFGELNKSKEIKTTEYVLIGTFASFTIAILLGLIMIRLIA